jgi:hypothetical protein
MMQKGLFINTEKAKCSIYESGLMVYNCIKGSAQFSLDYTELLKNDLRINSGYDFYLFNYHFITTGWLDTKSVKRLPGLKGTIILETLPNDPFVFCSPFDFDFYCVLDPSITLKHKKVFTFPRPLDNYTGPLSKKNNDIPVIGSFGFATKGKGFEHVVIAVNKEFERAVIRINIPYATYTDESHQYAHELSVMCKKLANPGVEVRVTHHFFTKEELIYWCSENTLNCFLYDRNHHGLSATTDQSITSERPLAISENNTFRHITKYLKTYPQISLKESIDKSLLSVMQMKKDWSKDSFRKLFENMLLKLEKKSAAQKKKQGIVTLSLVNKESFSYKLGIRYKNIIRHYYRSPVYTAFH